MRARRLWSPLAAAIAAVSMGLQACGDPGSAVDEPPPLAAGVEGAPTAQPGQAPAAGQTLRAVKARGYLLCGVHQGLLGFAYADNNGRWRGFDVDFCRATAAAVLGDGNAVRFIPTSSTDRFSALQSGEVDVLWRNTSGTFSRDATLNLAGVNYYDGQGFMAPRASGVRSAKDLDGARICIQTGSTNELNLTDWFRAHGLRYQPVVFDTEDKARSAYDREQCDALTADMSNLAAARVAMKRPDDHVLLPEIISKEPLGPVVRHGDDQWTDVVRWTLNATILAEELGITSQNLQAQRQSQSPEVRRLLGAEGGLGRMIGLQDDWAVKVIATSGNYGEIFERNLGAQTPLKLARGLNAPWNGAPSGLLFAAPMR
ncbi:amino acid ABC transporter substrate-binding protein [Caulobacter segnis]|uniref:amino acid ABC transporter substrate-binding protein n=1 Tax=Caulobacter segnis TaxID=88688 RepID=UPI00240ED320|nr:amino acid ABC transporter substrate-binding protein [Caulobacter segnis]MDG2522939.1 amino acid ABC transporter substrate-binding protein [Caulobacter segnis]